RAASPHRLTSVSCAPRAAWDGHAADPAATLGAGRPPRLGPAEERTRSPMDNADLEDVLDTVRSLVRDRVIPREAEIDETDEMPAELREEEARMGLFGFAI